MLNLKTKYIVLLIYYNLFLIVQHLIEEFCSIRFVMQNKAKYSDILSYFTKFITHIFFVKNFKVEPKKGSLTTGITNCIKTAVVMYIIIKCV
jgi:hypothetical protein